MLPAQYLLHLRLQWRLMLHYSLPPGPPALQFQHHLLLFLLHLLQIQLLLLPHLPAVLQSSHLPVPLLLQRLLPGRRHYNPLPHFLQLRLLPLRSVLRLQIQMRWFRMSVHCVLHLLLLL